MMWTVLSALGVAGLILLPLSITALFARTRGPEDDLRGLARIPYGVSMPTALISLTFIFLGLNAGAFAPDASRDDESIEERRATVAAASEADLGPQDRAINSDDESVDELAD